MAMLSTRTCVQVPPVTSGVFHLEQGFSTQQSNPNTTLRVMCTNKLAQTYQGYI